MKRLIVFLPKALLHLGAIVVIVYAFWPMARWYLEARPFWGVDFFYTASLVNLLRDNFVFPPTGWGYAWFTGWPLLSNYPILHLYLILPLTRFFGLLSSVEIWMVVSLGLFFLGSYAVFYQLCRNYVISGLLSIATVYSVGVYGALMWGGSLPNQATQAFFPWVIFFINAYLKKKRK